MALATFKPVYIRGYKKDGVKFTGRELKIRMYCYRTPF